MQRRKVAFFDFDGTLSRGYIAMEFMKYLKENGFYKKSMYERQMEVLEGHKSGRVSYQDWCIKWAILWAKGVEGAKKKDVEELAGSFFNDFKRNIYPFSFKLVSLLKERGYVTIIVSVSPLEVVSLAGSYVGFDEAYGTEVEVKNGKYTGRLKTKLHAPEGKRELVEKLLSDNYERASSMAFGDSVGDVSMLEAVSFPVALNPKGGLRKIAEERGWPTAYPNNVIEVVKNIIF